MDQQPADKFPLPETTTNPGRDFFYSSWQARGLVADFVTSLRYLDEVRRMNFWLVIQQDTEGYHKYVEEHRGEFIDELTKKGIVGDEANKILSEPFHFADHIVKDGRHAGKVLQEHLQFLLQTMLARAYDAFYRYAEALLRAIYEVNPNGLENAPETEDAVSKRVRKLTSSGQKENLYIELRETLGLSWLVTPFAVIQEGKIAAARHIITHNRVLIDLKYLQAPGMTHTPEDIGKSLLLTSEEVLADLEFLHEVVKIVDKQSADKYYLPLILVPAMTPTPSE